MALHIASSGNAAGGPAERPNHSGAVLIRLEGELRRCASSEELWLHLANEPLALLPFAQALVFEPNVRQADGGARAGSSWTAVAVSGLPRVNPDAPMLRWYERLVGTLWRQDSSSRTLQLFDATRHAAPNDPCTDDNAFPYLMWVPLADHQRPVMAGWLLARAQPWEEAHLTLAARLGLAYAHGLSAIAGRGRAPAAWRRQRPWLYLALLLGVLALALVHLPLTTLAPVEVTAQAPFVVTAPMPAVVERILVAPGAAVSAGTPLVQLVDTQLRSDYEVASKKLEVARAKTLRLQQASIADPAAKRELAIAQTEEMLARTEQDYAQAMLAKTLLHAPQAGVALYGDPRDWQGRPVAVGEAIMRIADPQRVEYQLKVPVADAVNLHEGAKVRVFLDAAPLQPLDANLSRAAYRAEADAAGIASFNAIAQASDSQAAPERLGLRGTARIYGEPVTLFYYLLRRPLTALRQASGI
ncbi:HlyD family efflux transporter periplasmic adaptor subunit [Pseudomonas sp. NFXW11]|uniref:efflux RND transporter periplasmic adaptor subunit n=1 Tax=Pseudomonas sp. NFXW11 TaxID=2819531 RepID=UPI003CF1ED27